MLKVVRFWHKDWYRNHSWSSWSYNGATTLK